MPVEYLIVLCASARDTQGQFEEVGTNGRYSGGPVRMAAAIVAAASTEHIVLLVGGSEQKVRDMKDYLLDHDIATDKMICIVSEADTLSNLRAVYKTCQQLLIDKRVGILSNDYHLERTLLLLQDPQCQWQATFVPIAAESLVTYNKPLEQSMRLRQTAEQQGIMDWKAGRYRNQQLDIAAWPGYIWE